MKRLLVLIAILTILVSGSIAVLAGPIHVGGGTLTTEMFSPIHVGGGTITALANAPVHAKAYGLHEKGIEESLSSSRSPIHVGGGT